MFEKHTERSFLNIEKREANSTKQILQKGDNSYLQQLLTINGKVLEVRIVREI